MHERRHLVLLLGSHAQRFAAGRHQLEVRARGEQFGEPGRGVDHLLEVVEQQQHRLVADVVDEAVLRSERLRRRLDDEGRVAQGRERNPPHALRVSLRKRSRGLCAEPCFTRTAGPGER